MMSNTMDLKPKMSVIPGKTVRLFLIDFVIDNNATVCGKEIKAHCEQFHKDLEEEFGAGEVQLGQSFESSNNVMGEIHAQMQKCKWTIQIMCDSQIPATKRYNEYFEYKKIIDDVHNMVFVCLDEVSKPNYTLFKTYYAGNSEPPQAFSMEHYTDISPLLLNADSISTGVMFNHYYSYFIKQVRTNNVIIKITFNKNIIKEQLPSQIQIELNTMIESFYMDPHRLPTDKHGNLISPDETELQPLQSRKLDLSLNKIEDDKIAVFAAASMTSTTGISDFGKIVRTRG
ncbi:unnamed protein product [Didymodactylos carnosus]|uniref:Uncharacterized protein n=1 Tax=Didymodactylos carnosus TaxID=1234261 RepID=A0A815ZFF2_9BILA|nr:unnamed protein product [Didymodactylos carnosus]CAF1582573.1 unnamed protein product [Didymodactylos carnosus]CAF4222717.1 unnamed protein product [Didymodactylos carnosus]CAF4450681.1 unnamed protein product [Didymodactylos carnosus]